MSNILQGRVGLGLTPRWANSQRLRLCIAALAGTSAATGWAPWSCWPLVLVSYAVLASLLVRAGGWRGAAAIGWVYGLGLHLIGHSWVYYALRVSIGWSVIPAVLVDFLFALCFACFIALPCAGWYLLSKTTGLTLAASLFAALFTLGEYARGLLFNGFSSLSCGYALVDTPLLSFAPVIGLYGISALAYFISALLGLISIYAVERRAALAAGAVIVAVFAASHALGLISWVEPAGRLLRYRLIQGHTPQQQKFDPAWRQTQLDSYLTAIKSKPADLIVTPETALPLYLNELPVETLERIETFSRITGSHVFFGVFTRSADGRNHNSLVTSTPSSAVLLHYDKVRLMPLGEYSPLGLDWLSERFSIAHHDLDSGEDIQQPFSIAGQRIGTLLCNEDDNSANVRRWMPDVTLLLNPSNLDWFVGGSAQAQRTDIVRMRAAESGRPILRVDNSGMTALIDHRGRIVAKLPIGMPGTLSGRVTPMRGVTPFMHWGEFPILALLALPLMLTLLRWRLTSPSAACGRGLGCGGKSSI